MTAYRLIFIVLILQACSSKLLSPLQGYHIDKQFNYVGNDKDVDYRIEVYQDVRGVFNSLTNYNYDIISFPDDLNTLKNGVKSFRIAQEIDTLKAKAILLEKFLASYNWELDEKIERKNCCHLVSIDSTKFDVCSDDPKFTDLSQKGDSITYALNCTSFPEVFGWISESFKVNNILTSNSQYNQLINFKFTCLKEDDVKNYFEYFETLGLTFTNLGLCDFKTLHLKPLTN